MVYNAHAMMKDYYTYEDIRKIPLKHLLDLIDYFKPKLREIERQQQQNALKMELIGKRDQMKPNGRR